MSKKILFVGLGNMGVGMTRNLIKKTKYQVYGYDIVKDRIKRCEEFGVKSAYDLSNSDFKQLHAILTIIPKGETVMDYYKSDFGPYKYNEKKERSNTLLLELSTIGPDWARKLYEESRKRGFDFVSAPCSGGTFGADNGTLTFMTGYDHAEHFDKARDMLEAMGKKIYKFDKVDQGQAVKIVNNMLLGIQMSAFVEACLLADKMGLDKKVMSDVVSQSTGNCWLVTHYNPVPGAVPGSASCNDYEGGFLASLQAKDIGLAYEKAKKEGLNLPLCKTSYDQFTEVTKQGYGNKDFGILYPQMKKKYGLH